MAEIVASTWQSTENDGNLGLIRIKSGNKRTMRIPFTRGPMPTPGLSLVGFMEPPLALLYFRNACVPVDPSDAALMLEWTAARAKLGAAVGGAGKPDIQPLPADAAAHVQHIVSSQWAQTIYGAPLTQDNFRMVELDKLLAFQFTVDGARSQHHCGALTKPPLIGELLNLCLPLTVPNEDYKVTMGPQSALLKARSLNLRTFAAGVNQTFMGLQFGVAPPFMQVVRFNDRCYLHNGFHRALGVRGAGATHAPCIFRDVTSAQEVGLMPGGTFPLDLLESEDPPTIEHFTRGSAYDVNVRAVSRVLHVSWAEYAVPDE